MIQIQMNEAVATRLPKSPATWQAKPTGFAFTFELPAIPSKGSLVIYAGRQFRVLQTDWHPHDPWPVRLLVREVRTR